MVWGETCSCVRRMLHALQSRCVACGSAWQEARTLCSRQILPAKTCKTEHIYIPTLNNELNWRTKWLSSPIHNNVLIIDPILRIWPCWTTTCPLDQKKIERSPFFSQRRGHSCSGDLVWMDNLLGSPPCENYSNRLRSVLSFVGSVLNKSQVWLL